MSETNPLNEAIKKAGGQAALASAIGVRQQLVSYWLHKSKRGVPGEYVIPVERVTGISRHELRPDLYPEDGP